MLSPVARLTQINASHLLAVEAYHRAEQSELRER